MKKVIICFGDSWTAGHFLNPEIENFDGNFIGDDNKEYCNSRTWVKYLNDYTNIETVNLGQPACSNDMIVRKINLNLKSYLRKFKPDEIFAIVGWSSPERKTIPIEFFDFKNNLTTRSELHLLPSEGINLSTLKKYQNEFGEYDGEKLWEFYKSYFYYFWNAREYMTRHRNNIILTDNIFQKLKIDVLYFDAFYEISSFQSDKKKILDFEIALEGPLGEIVNNIYSKKFIPFTFRQFLENKNDKSLFEQDDYHPTEIGHRLWAEFLGRKLYDRKKI